MKITAVVITKNEQVQIRECLKTLKFCNEIIVIDDNSIDKTRDFSEKFGATVHKNDAGNDFSRQRNFALKKASNEWVLFIDADERVNKKLAKEIKNAVEKKGFSGFKFTRRDIFLNKQLKFGETAGIRLVRLAKKSTGKWVRPVHEVWDIRGKVGMIKEPIIHFSHQSISSLIDDINYYTGIESEYRKQNRYRAIIEMFIYPFGKFLNNYIFRLGFLDGFPGFVMAYLMSLHSLFLRVNMIERRL